MATLKTKSKLTTKSSEEKVQNRLFINLGFTIEVGEEEVFVNLPLSLTADNLDKAIESVESKINKNTPTEMKEIFAGKIAIAEAVQSLFSVMKDSQSVKASEIDPEDETIGFLSDMEIQFYKAPEKEEIDTSDVKVSVVSKLKKKTK